MQVSCQRVQTIKEVQPKHSSGWKVVVRRSEDVMNGRFDSGDPAYRSLGAGARIGILLLMLAGLAGLSYAVYARPAHGQSEFDSSAKAPAVNRPVRDKWALVVGISKFQDPAQNLEFPAKDAEDFATYLVREAGFAPDHVKLLLNSAATEKRILSELGNKWLPRVANPDDLVVIFISTHGSGAELDVGGQNYLVAYDTDVNDLYTSGIPMNRLAEDIRDRVHCERVVIFLDACHSGATKLGAKGLSRTGVDADEFAVGSGQLVITSSTENQVSWESKSRKNSVFTSALLDALRSNGDKTSLGEMFFVLKDRVQDTVLRERGVLQTPVMKSAWLGQDIVLAAKPMSRQPGFDSGSPTFDVLMTARAGKRTGEETGSSTPSVAGVSSRAGVGKPELVAHAHGTTTLAQPSNAVSERPLSERTPASHTVATPGSSLLAQPALDAHKANDLAVASIPSVKPSALLVPGSSIGRTMIGTSKDDVVKRLGKPGDVQGDSYIYRTADKKYFLLIHFHGDTIAEIVFSSPVFSTAELINLATFRKHFSDFQPPRVDANGRFDILSLKGGGFSVLVSRDGMYGGPIGVIHAKTTSLDELDWLPGVLGGGAFGLHSFGRAASVSPSSPSTPSAPRFVPSTSPTGVSTLSPSALSTAATVPRPPVASRPTTTPVSAGSPGAASTSSPEEKTSTSGIVPGSLLGKTRLGTSRSDLVKRLGRPTEEKGDVATYWTGDRKRFVSFRFSSGVISDIAFSSSSFATADGISVASFKAKRDQFGAPSIDGGWQLMTLKQGGLTMATGKGKTVGWLHASSSRPSGIFWPEN